MGYDPYPEKKVARSSKFKCTGSCRLCSCTSVKFIQPLLHACKMQEAYDIMHIYTIQWDFHCSPIMQTCMQDTIHFIGSSNMQDSNIIYRVMVTLVIVMECMHSCDRNVSFLQTFKDEEETFVDTLRNMLGALVRLITSLVVSSSLRSLLMISCN